MSAPVHVWRTADHAHRILCFTSVVYQVHECDHLPKILLLCLRDEVSRDAYRRFRIWVLLGWISSVLRFVLVLKYAIIF